MCEPVSGWRVPYVFVYGSPGLPLIQLVRSPEDVLNNLQNLIINAHYYISGVIIPPLHRCLSLLNIDTHSW